MPLLALTLCVLVASSNAPQPMAVAPFSNLNADASLRWLEQGAAETVAADLKKSGVAVVERAQIATALKQVEASVADEVARAVAAGRIVGARSIVLGSFQRSAGQIRLVARVVDVESGVVSEAAKVTGAVDTIFTLQDGLVAALAKRAGTQPVRPKRNRGTGAYERYALSLSAPDDTTQRALLDEALRLDPGLVYARDAMAALEARMRASSALASVALDARESRLLGLVEDSKAPADTRQQAATALLEGLERGRRYRALLRSSERVLAANVPGDVIVDVAERASADRVLALARLVEVDAALQAGEKHLAAFPAGPHRTDVEKTMRDLVEDRRSLPTRRQEYRDELGQLAADVAAAKENAAKANGALDAEQRLGFAWKPCIAAKWSRLPDEMLQHCAAFLAAHARSEHSAAARAYIAWAHAMKGEMAEAHRLAAALEAEVPGALDDTGLRSLIQERWSAD